eukprot:gb/GFBE01043368.1/.p1 GENE.gb/GFBE01043368.1/~~gb/GFBE01043368.1/.p1  ORF type:complete len:247 (+),score=49.89 gb/GFBE01043368.1/:1-741(+)
MRHLLLRRHLVLGTRCRHVGATPSPEADLLWAPGQYQEHDDKRYERLAGKIGLKCREYNGYCVIGARGEAAVANALRGLARASELGKSPVEFRVRWHEDPGDERSLRFYAEICETWSDFKKRWAANKETPKPLEVTPHTSVHKLATAVVINQRKIGGAALKLNYKNDTVMSIAGKALASLPHLAHHEDLGCGLVCIMRWPSIANPEASKFVYAHVLWKHLEAEKKEVPPGSGMAASEASASRAAEV